MVGQPVTFESGHTDMVHDCQLDYYGKRLATCSSDRSVKIFEITGDQKQQIGDLRGHDGPVWEVSWAHPKFGSLLASCSFDHKVIIWKENQENQFVQVYKSPATLHTASINSISWAPHELGLILASASSDGTVGLMEYTKDGHWETKKIDNVHAMGCTAVSWSPAVPPGALISAKPPTSFRKRFVTSGCDNTAKVWGCTPDGEWKLEATLSGHTDWVRDAAWAPNLGLPFTTIATAGQDGKVLAWSERNGTWEKVLVTDQKSPVWRVSWSVTGSILAVSDGSGAVTLWKETMDGQWEQLSQ